MIYAILDFLTLFVCICALIYLYGMGIASLIALSHKKEKGKYKFMIGIVSMTGLTFPFFVFFLFEFFSMF